MPCVLITGANRGLGLEFTRQLLQRGFRVMACCRHPQEARALQMIDQEYGDVLQIAGLDMTKPETFDSFAKQAEARLGAIDLLINNAGILVSGERFGNVTPDALESSFRVNSAGPFLLTQALTDRLASGARIVNISSVLGSITQRDSFYTPSYCISKAALNMATVLLARALAERNAIVVALHPGWVRTDMGGSNADIAPETSVTGLLQAIDHLKASDSGRFLDYHGRALPW